MSHFAILVWSVGWGFLNLQTFTFDTLMVVLAGDLDHDFPGCEQSYAL